MTRTHPAPTKADFHCALLWLRSLEILTGSSSALMMSELELHDLFQRYRSPWRA
jgi:hypothetical protein